MTIFKKLIELLTRREQRQMVGLLFLMLVGMAFEVIGLSLVIPAIALMTQPNLVESYPKLKPVLELIGNPSQVELVARGMLVLIGVYLFKTIFLIFMVSRQNKFIFGIQESLSLRLFKMYLKQPWTFHLQRNSAQLILNATNEVSIFVGNALQPGMIILTEGLVLLGIAGLLFIIEPIAALAIMLLFGGAALGFQRIFRKYLLRWGEARQLHDGLRIQHLQQGLGGAKDVKLLGRENNFFAEYNTHNKISAQVGQKQKTLLEFPRLWLELLAVIGLAGLVAIMLAQGQLVETLVSTLGLFAAAAFRLMPSLNRVLGAFQSLRYGLPVINTLHQEILTLDVEVKTQLDSMLEFKKAITVEQIDYRYGKAHNQALAGISFTIPYGSSVGFIGASGAGKSTLVDVILGLLPPDRGYVRVDGEDIQTSLRSWQDKIGYVPQSIFLTDDTLRRNIAFGLPEDLIDNLAVERAVKAAQLDGFVSSLSLGLETFVGERGVRLSGGQRQRIGIARALYHDPAVLVLDEATSALDTQTEKGVMEAINALHGDKTILIVAHRLSTVSNCDKLYKLEQGQIVEEGSFKDLTREKVF